MKADGDRVHLLSSTENNNVFTHTLVCFTQRTWISFKSVQPFIFTVFKMSLFSGPSGIDHFITWPRNIYSCQDTKKSHSLKIRRKQAYTFKDTCSGTQILFADVGLLGCNAVWNCRYIPVFRGNILFPSLTMKMEIVYSSETLVSTYKSTRGYNP
jgi:hypothetical protein